MEIVKIYESASTDGYTHTGDGLYFLDETIAIAVAKNKHGSYSVNPILHKGIAIDDKGGYILVYSDKPIALADSEAEKECIRMSAISKLSKEECEVLGIKKGENHEKS